MATDRARQRCSRLDRCKVRGGPFPLTVSFDGAEPNGIFSHFIDSVGRGRIIRRLLAVIYYYCHNHCLWRVIRFGQSFWAINGRK